MSTPHSPSRFRNLAYAVMLFATASLGSLAGADAPPEAAPREIDIVVQGGYHPSQIDLRVGERARLRFTRKEYNSCSKEVVFPTLGIRRELPPNVPVTIDFPARTVGEYEFHCGMNMIRGKVVVTNAR